MSRLLEATIDQRLAETRPEWSAQAAVCVVMASGGYPGAYETGRAITGLPPAEALVFHAGTRLEDGAIVTSGGRVLGVTALRPTLREARDAAYAAVHSIHFDGAHFRTDIAAKGLR